MYRELAVAFSTREFGRRALRGAGVDGHRTLRGAGVFLRGLRGANLLLLCDLAFRGHTVKSSLAVPESQKQRERH